MKPTTNRLKNRIIVATPNKPVIATEIAHGNKYIISRSKIINKMAIK